MTAPSMKRVTTSNETEAMLASPMTFRGQHGKDLALLDGELLKGMQLPHLRGQRRERPLFRPSSAWS
eukprot:13268274-Heterocapsa_arctica.AAC.1